MIMVVVVETDGGDGDAEENEMVMVAIWKGIMIEMKCLSTEWDGNSASDLWKGNIKSSAVLVEEVAWRAKGVKKGKGEKL